MHRLRTPALVLLAGALGATLAYSQQRGRGVRTVAQITLHDYVDDDTWRSAGLDRLSSDQRAVLDTWFRGYTVHCYRAYANKPNAGVNAPAPPDLAGLRYEGVQGEEPDNAHALRSASGTVIVLDDGSRWRTRRTTAEMRMLEVWESGDEIYVWEASPREQRRFPKHRYKIRDRTRGPGFVRVEFLGY